MLPIRFSIPRSLAAVSRPSQSIAGRACTSFATRRLSSQASAAAVRRIGSTVPITAARNFPRIGVRSISTTHSFRLKEESPAPPPEDDLRIYSFEDVYKLANNPEPTRLLVDVREPHELKKTGELPNSVNIPLETSPDAWFLPEEAFQDKFGFEKPSLDTELVFSCKSGVRSSSAARIAKMAGYRNTASYKGSWLDWAKNTGAPTY
ncbi:hypothetical protein TWF694_011647 [Orbilia ellipsospora]|uniref:Rhodanese domain-containing protein n=1 Tax=Orbilia ellipsospora TaxID=2528407 RepID=A0AAV9X713_9PEZI